jgi:hypothetical protein
MKQQPVQGKSASILPTAKFRESGNGRLVAKKPTVFDRGFGTVMYYSRLPIQQKTLAIFKHGAKCLVFLADYC